MGVVKRQSIKHSIINYVGVLIGAFSTLVIYPLSKEIYGLAQFLISTAAFLVPLASMGILALTVRFFPVFKNQENKHNGYLGLLILLLLGSISIFLVLVLIFQDYFFLGLQNLKFNVDLFKENSITLTLLCIIAVFNSLFIGYISNFKLIVIPTLLNNFIPKIVLPVLVALYYFEIFTIAQVTLGIVLYYAFILVALIFYTRSLNQLHIRPKFSFIDAKLLKEMRVYAFYGILGTMGGILAFRIDGIMVSSLLDVGSNGIYFMILFIAGTIEIPAKAINAIAAPIIATAWKENNIKEIKEIYQKSSINLLIAGSFIFILIWSSADNIFRLSSNYNDLSLGINALFFLGMAKLVDMVTSVNTEIIRFSKFFRFNLVAVLILGVVNVLTNYLFIPQFQITGAAMATFLSILLFNVLKLIYIKVKINIYPFTWSTFWVVVITGIAYTLGLFVPSTNLVFLDIVIKSAVITLTFIPLILYFKISPDLNELVVNLLKNIKERLF